MSEEEIVWGINQSGKKWLGEKMTREEMAREELTPNHIICLKIKIQSYLF
jgi:hypothetical protein